MLIKQDFLTRWSETQARRLHVAPSPDLRAMQGRANTSGFMYYSSHAVRALLELCRIHGTAALDFLSAYVRVHGRVSTYLKVDLVTCPSFFGHQIMPVSN